MKKTLTALMLAGALGTTLAGSLRDAAAGNGSCTTVAAAKTVGLGHEKEIIASGFPPYGVAGCDDYFVADLKVSSGSSRGGYSTKFKLDVGTDDFWTNKPKCIGTVMAVSYYRKRDGESAFTHIGGGQIRGKWDDATNTCWAAEQLGFVDPGWFRPPPFKALPPNPPFGAKPAPRTDTYRVLAISRRGAAKLVVRPKLYRNPVQHGDEEK